MTKREVREICTNRGFEAHYCGKDNEDNGFHINPLKRNMLIDSIESIKRKLVGAEGKLKAKLEAQLDQARIWLGQSSKLTNRFSILINHAYKTY